MSCVGSSSSRLRRRRRERRWGGRRPGTPLRPPGGGAPVGAPPPGRPPKPPPAGRPPKLLPRDRPGHRDGAPAGAAAGPCGVGPLPGRDDGAARVGPPPTHAGRGWDGAATRAERRAWPGGGGTGLPEGLRGGRARGAFGRRRGRRCRGRWAAGAVGGAERGPPELCVAGAWRRRGLGRGRLGRRRRWRRGRRRGGTAADEARRRGGAGPSSPRRRRRAPPVPWPAGRASRARRRLLQRCCARYGRARRGGDRFLGGRPSC